MDAGDMPIVDVVVVEVKERLKFEAGRYPDLSVNL
jgi:hypothetical protein